MRDQIQAVLGEVSEAKPVPRCVDCKYYRFVEVPKDRKGETQHRCVHHEVSPASPRYVVSGNDYDAPGCEWARLDPREVKNENAERWYLDYEPRNHPGGPCRSSGKLFEPRPAPRPWWKFWVRS